PMKLAAFTLGALLFVSPASAEQPSPPDALMAQFAKAWTQKDVAAVANLFADDVTLVGKPPTIGRDAVVAWAKRQMASGGGMTIEGLRSGVGGSVAFHAGRWTLGTGTGSHTFVMRQFADGKWRIISMLIV